MPGKHLFAILLLTLGVASAQNVTVHIGHYPNVTHAQAVVAEARHDFQSAFGPNVKVDWKLFNSGTEETQALFAGAIDIAYIGPGPSLTGYVRSHGEAFRVIAGAVSGGAELVVRADSGIRSPADFHGKRIATPSLGNTQDIALRAWLQAHHLRTVQQGGDVTIIPVYNPDQLTLFLRKQIDAAWAPEPWASRLVHRAHGRVFLDERTLWPQGRFVATQVVVNEHFLRQHPDLVQKFLVAHVAVTRWIQSHPDQARQVIAQELQRETHEALLPAVLQDSLAHLTVTWDPIRSSLLRDAAEAQAAHFLPSVLPNLAQLYDLGPLNQVLSREGLPPVQ